MQSTTGSSQETLPGANTRLAAGISQCVLGMIEIAFGITIISLSWTNESDNVDRVSFGIWGGVELLELQVEDLGVWYSTTVLNRHPLRMSFSILAGAFGVTSRRSRCLVISYMVFSIVAATLGVVSMAVATLGIVLAKLELDANVAVSRGRAHLGLYIALCASFFLQVLASIIGASFTCGAFFTIQPATSTPMVFYNPPQSPSPLDERGRPHATIAGSTLPPTPTAR
ncbi:hypothetical protein HOLleu_35868 [Holothuria leucospilota]|uniref:Uncharacterized protein n=1 Tax=Holothuria leucospilota TaxID=206669 RepID=A0A9Q0YJH1_HOLLE|nr:hypothetical protein HOLleu_35868 [Holothuria leucospilota]